MILDRGPTPLYYQLKTVLESKILSQELKESERLPSEAELCEQYNVSRVTVRQALSELMKAGLIYRDRGKGSFVTEGAGLKRPVLKGSIEDLIDAAKGTRIKIISYKEVAPPPTIVTIPKLGKHAKIFQMEMVRYIPKGPMGYSLLYFPPDLGKLISVTGQDDMIEMITFAEEKLKTKAHRANQSIDVGVADDVLAKHLSVRPQTPLLIIQREYYTREGSLMFVARNYFRTDRFKYEIELTRARKIGGLWIRKILGCFYQFERIAGELNKEPAIPEEARKILGLKSA
jgi:GntR family transcriptional regulator